MNINRVAISGNLTRDPDYRVSASGMGILNFSIASNARQKNSQTGEWEDYANYVDCVKFGNGTDYLSQHIHKGSKVVVEGRLHYSSWEKDGQKRSKLEIIVDNLDFVSPKSDGQQGYQQPAPAHQTARHEQSAQFNQAPMPSAQQPVTTQPPVDVYDEDIPF
jgi:single-strand DNA-binding protein